MNESCGNIQFFYSGNTDLPVYFRTGALRIAYHSQQPLQFRAPLVSGFPSIKFFMCRNNGHAGLLPDPFSILVETHACFCVNFLPASSFAAFFGSSVPSVSCRTGIEEVGDLC